MKRRQSVFIMLAVLLFLSPFHNAAMGDALDFVPGEYIRNEQYPATFTYRSVQLEGCSFAYADHAGLALEEAEGLAVAVEGDVRLFREKLAKAGLREPTVYAVLRTDRTGAYAVGEALFCTPEDIRSGRYQHALIKCMLGSKDAWVAEGCLAYVLDEPYDDASIRAYVSSNGGGITGLWDTRFYETLNTAEELAMARQMAHSLVEDVIREHGMASLTGPIPGAWKAAWCERLALPARYDSEIGSCLEGLSFRWDSQFDLIVESEHAVYFLKAGAAGLENADILEEFLYRSEYGRADILEYLHGRVSDANEQWMRENLSQVNCKVFEGISRAPGNNILLSELFAYQHEQTHVMLRAEAKPLAIISEGIAVYFDLLLYPYSYNRDMIRYTLMQTDRKSSWCVGYEVYCRYGGELTEEGFDMRLYIDALALYASEHPGLPESIPQIGTQIQDIPIYNGLSEEGKELSYLQGCSLVGYLIDQYGLNCVLDYMRLGMPFEEAFGMPFEQAAEGWKATLFRE